MANTTREYRATRLVNSSARTAQVTMPPGLTVNSVRMEHANTLVLNTTGDQTQPTASYTATVVPPGGSAPDGASLIGSVDWTANLDVNANGQQDCVLARTCQVYLKANA